jgi:hypothetical protein
MRSENATTKGRLFMWKLNELKKSAKDKEDKEDNSAQVIEKPDKNH